MSFLTLLDIIILGLLSLIVGVSVGIYIAKHVTDDDDDDDTEGMKNVQAGG